MDENKEETESASNVDQINLGPFRHVIHFQETGGERKWKHVESDVYLPQEILDQARGCHPDHIDYFVRMLAEWGVNLQFFTLHDGVKIGYIRQTHRRWTIFGDLFSLFGYYKSRIHRPAKEEQKAMWEAFENTDPPQGGMRDS